MTDRWDTEALHTVEEWACRLHIVDDQEGLEGLVAAALREAYAAGLREGREAERADIVRWLDAHGWLDAGEDIERAEHVPTPQGDEPDSLVPLSECESNDSNRPAKPEEWGWFLEGGSLQGSLHPTRESAIREAVVDYEAEHFLVGRMVDLDLAQWVDSERIAEQVREDIYGNLGLEDVDVSAVEGAEEALEAWARKYLEADTSRYCDGEDVRVSRSQARRLAAQRGEPAPDYGPGRCEVCGWPLAESEADGCVPGNCSYRSKRETDHG